MSWNLHVQKKRPPTISYCDNLSNYIYFHEIMLQVWIKLQILVSAACE